MFRARARTRARARKSIRRWNPVKDDPEYEKAKRYVVWRLSAQSYHSEPLKRLLKRKGYPQDIVEALITECQARGLLDDRAWLESFVRQRLGRESARAVVAKLRAKGIPSKEAAEAVACLQDPDEEKQQIARLLETRYRSRNLGDFKERQKVVASLLRRGYPYEAVAAALVRFKALNDGLD